MPAPKSELWGQPFEHWASDRDLRVCVEMQGSMLYCRREIAAVGIANRGDLPSAMHRHPGFLIGCFSPTRGPADCRAFAVLLILGTTTLGTQEDG